MDQVQTLLTISATAILITLSIIGYFLKIVHNDVRGVVSEVGKLKGKVELIDQPAKFKECKIGKESTYYPYC